MQNGIDSMVFEYAVNRIFVKDISFDKHIIFSVFNLPQIHQIAGISEFVEIYDFVTGVFFYQVTNQIRSDKSGTAGNQNIFVEFFHEFDDKVMQDNKF